MTHNEWCKTYHVREADKQCRKCKSLRWTREVLDEDDYDRPMPYCYRMWEECNAPLAVFRGIDVHSVCDRFEIDPGR